MALGLAWWGWRGLDDGFDAVLLLFKIRDAADSEARTPFGLIKGHAYTVTGIDQVGAGPTVGVWEAGHHWTLRHSVSASVHHGLNTFPTFLRTFHPQE
jgi:hypothetical protein